MAMTGKTQHVHPKPAVDAKQTTSKMGTPKTTTVGKR